MSALLTLLVLQAITVVESRPPKVCTVAGITLGLTTMEKFERRYGNAKRITGGHPRGAGLWYDRRTGTMIHADGFNIATGGRVLDGMSFDWMPESNVQKDVPRIRLQKADLGLLAKLRRGMSLREVESQVGHRLTKSELKLKGLVRYSSKLINKDDDRYTAWTLSFQFGEKGLASFSALCD